MPELNLRQYNIDDASGGSVVGMQHQVLTGILTSDFRYLKAHPLFPYFLPARASEQGNVIGSVRIYIAYYTSKSVICISYYMLLSVIRI